MKRAWMSIVFAAIFLAGCSTQPTDVGSYIASDPNTAMMVQIKSLEDGQVDGTMSMVTSDENGKTNAIARPFTGTLEGTALNLSVENGRGISLVTGILDGENLKLTFFNDGSSSQIAFVKKDASEFDKLVGNTRTRSAEKLQEIETAAAQKDRIEQRSKTQKSIDGLADRLTSRMEEISEKTKKLDAVVAGYGSARSRIAKLQASKRGINPNSDDGSYRISSLDYDIDGISSDMDSMHRDVQSYAQDLDRFMDEASSRASSLISECGADVMLNCTRLTQALRLATARNQEFQSGLSRERAAFSRQQSAKS